MPRLCASCAWVLRVLARVAEKLCPPVACRQSVREFSGQTGGFTASHPPLTSVEPEHWWPQLLHWALRVAAVLFGKLLTMADTEGGNDGYDNMETSLKEAGVKTSWSRTEHKESGKIHHTVSMGGDSLYILLEEWHKENLARHPSHYASLARWMKMTLSHFT